MAQSTLAVDRVAEILSQSNSRSHAVDKGNKKTTNVLAACAGSEIESLCCCFSSSDTDCTGEEGGFKKFWHPAYTMNNNSPEQGPSVPVSTAGTCAAESYCCRSFQKADLKTTAEGLECPDNTKPADDAICMEPVPSASSLAQKDGQPADELFGAEAFDELFEKKDNATGGGADELLGLQVLQAKPNEKGKGVVRGRDYTLIIDRSGSMGDPPVGILDEVEPPKAIADELGLEAKKQTMNRWTQVKGALEYLAPFVTKEDPDGISVLFFDGGLNADKMCCAAHFDEHEGVCGADAVQQLFDTNQPRGATFLADVLAKAMEPDTIGRAETIFVLLDGAVGHPFETDPVKGAAGPWCVLKADPSKKFKVREFLKGGSKVESDYKSVSDDSWETVKVGDTETKTKDECDIEWHKTDRERVAEYIIKHTHTMCDKQMLSISFIQVGSDQPGTADNLRADLYLKSLDDLPLGDGADQAKYDIVDAMTADKMKENGDNFMKLITTAVHE